MTPADLWAMLMAPGLHEVRLPGATCWLPTTARRRFERLVARFGDDDVRVSPAPRLDRSTDLRITPLWPVLAIRGESSATAAILAGFQPQPTLTVIEVGTVRRTAVWALEQPLLPRWADIAHRRLGLALLARKTPPDLIPVGAKISLDRNRPIETAQVWTGEVYDSRAIVGAARPGGELRDPPEARLPWAA